MWSIIAGVISLLATKKLLLFFEEVRVPALYSYLIAEDEQSYSIGIVPIQSGLYEKKACEKS